MRKYLNAKVSLPPISIYVVTFFTTLHYAFTVYVTSTILETFVGSVSVGAMYSFAAICSIFFLSSATYLERRFGLAKLTKATLLGNIVGTATIGVAAAALSTGNYTLINGYPSLAILAVPAFFVLESAVLGMRVLIDTYLEHFSVNSTTGLIRATYLTVINLVFVFSPFIAGRLVDNYGHAMLFAVAAMFNIISYLVYAIWMSKLPVAHFKHMGLVKTIRGLRHNRNISFILCSVFLLELFYVLMVIYTPIYLNTTLGFDWGTIGKIFSFMLLPFVLLQLPLGKIADKRLGEQEILIAGFLVAGIFTSALALTSSRSAVVWALLLFGTRVGASMIEVMNETYFFKKISDKDLALMSFFRHLAAIAMLVGPAISTLFVSFLPFHYIFLLMGLLMFSGVYFVSQIEDTL